MTFEGHQQILLIELFITHTHACENQKQACGISSLLLLRGAQHLDSGPQTRL